MTVAGPEREDAVQDVGLESPAKNKHLTYRGRSKNLYSNKRQACNWPLLETLGLFLPAAVLSIISGVTVERRHKAQGWTDYYLHDPGCPSLLGRAEAEALT